MTRAHRSMAKQTASSSPSSCWQSAWRVYTRTASPDPSGNRVHGTPGRTDLLPATPSILDVACQGLALCSGGMHGCDLTSIPPNVPSPVIQRDGVEMRIWRGQGPAGPWPPNAQAATSSLREANPRFLARNTVIGLPPSCRAACLNERPSSTVSRTAAASTAGNCSSQPSA